MASKCFKIMASMSMLLIYLMVMVVSNISVIVCDCHSHHHSHHVVAHEQHKCCCGGCHSSDFCDGYESAVSQKCGCKHDHSNEVTLYIASRTSSDDILERNVILTALLSDPIEDLDAVAVTDAVQEFGLYLLPPLSSAVEGCDALRAPPAMV